MAKSPVQQFIDAGMHFTELSRKQAESLVKSLVQSGEVRRKDAEQTVQQLVARGKETTDKINAMVEAEVSKQIAAARVRFEELEARVESLAGQLRSGASSTPAKQAPAKKTAAAKQAVGSSGVRKVSTTRKR